MCNDILDGGGVVVDGVSAALVGVQYSTKGYILDIYICMALKIVYFVLITANGSNNTSFCYQQGNLF